MQRGDVERKPTFLPVVAAAIFDAQTRVLLQQCLPHKRHAGLWEFPGGKVEIGETPRFALCREIDEELGLQLLEENLQPAGFAEELTAEGTQRLVLFLYTCRRWQGRPRSREGQRWGWFTLEEAARLPLPAIDRVMLGKLSPDTAA